MIIFNKERDLEKFYKRLVTLTPEQFMGLTTVLDVRLSSVDAKTGEYSVKDAEAIIDEMAAAFYSLSHKERKLVLKAMKG